MTFRLAARAATATAMRSKIQIELMRRHDSGLYRGGLTCADDPPASRRLEQRIVTRESVPTPELVRLALVGL